MKYPPRIPLKEGTQSVLPPSPIHSILGLLAEGGPTQRCYTAFQKWISRVNSLLHDLSKIQIRVQRQPQQEYLQQHPQEAKIWALRITRC